MESSINFRVIFIFTLYSGAPGLAGSLTVTGANSFALDGQNQILPYGTSATPALTNLSLNNESFQFSGAADPFASSQSLELVTTVTANGNTLDITVANVAAETQIRCQFPGYPGEASLSLGPNSIPFPLT